LFFRCVTDGGEWAWLGTRFDVDRNRNKHVGRTDKPEIARMANGEFVGRCPANFPEDRRQALLDKAIPHITSAPYSTEFPKRLYVVDESGTIYTAQTTNPGDSYHGYPYAGRMGRRLIEALRVMAQEKKCEEAFETWLRRHIRVGGPPDL